MGYYLNRAWSLYQSRTWTKVGKYRDDLNPYEQELPPQFYVRVDAIFLDEDAAQRENNIRALKETIYNIITRSIQESDDEDDVLYCEIGILNEFIRAFELDNEAVRGQPEQMGCALKRAWTMYRLRHWRSSIGAPDPYQQGIRPEFYLRVDAIFLDEDVSRREESIRALMSATVAEMEAYPRVKAPRLRVFDEQQCDLVYGSTGYYLQLELTNLYRMLESIELDAGMRPLSKETVMSTIKMGHHARCKGVSPINLLDPAITELIVDRLFEDGVTPELIKRIKQVKEYVTH